MFSSESVLLSFVSLFDSTRFVVQDIPLLSKLKCIFDLRSVWSALAVRFLLRPSVDSSTATSEAAEATEADGKNGETAESDGGDDSKDDATDTEEEPAAEEPAPLFSTFNKTVKWVD